MMTLLRSIGLHFVKYLKNSLCFDISDMWLLNTGAAEYAVIEFYDQRLRCTKELMAV